MPGYFTLICDKTPPAARDRREVICILNGLYYPHTGTDELIWWLNCSPTMFEGLPIKDEVMDVARSAPQEAHYHHMGHYHADVI